MKVIFPSCAPNLEGALMVGSYLLQMNLRSGRGADGFGHGSTSAGVGHGQEGHGENGRENANGES
jgi:hypothetical protein